MQAIANDIVYAIAALPNQPMLVAACQSGLRRSDDGGLTWNPVLTLPDVDNQPSATSLVVSDTILVGVPGGVIRSLDMGASWTAAGLTTPPPFVTALALSPDFAQDGIVFAGTFEDGIFRSSNHGATWELWNFGLFDLSVLNLVVSPNFTRDQTVYAATETGIYISRNRGRAWQQTSFPTGAAPVLCLALTQQLIFAGTETNGLLTSSDRGQSWQRIGHFDGSAAINAILLDAATIIVMTDDTLWRSDNEGQSWSVTGKFENGLTAIAAPSGLGQAESLIVGLDDGRIIRTAGASLDDDN